MIKRSLLLLFFLITSLTWAQDSESERLLLNKINSLEKEIQTLLSQLEEINYKLNRIEDTQQLRYVDLDKRIHELEGILLVQEEIEGTNIDELDPLAGLIEEDDASNEFELWSDSLQLIEDGRFAESSEKLRYLILSFPEGNFIGDALFWLGEIYFLQENYIDSSDSFNELKKIGINSVAICSNDFVNYPEDSFDNMIKFSNDNQFNFPYLHDDTQKIAKSYDAVCTPDFFGYNKDLELQYRGRLRELKNFVPVKDEESDLLKSMKQIAENGKGPQNQIPSAGCGIKWKYD